MPEKKEYVKLWTSYKAYFESYSAAEVGRLVLAMIDYKSSGVEPEFSGSERFIWPAIKRDIDEAGKASEKAAQAHRAAGASGGRPQNPKNQIGFAETKDNQKNQIGFQETKMVQGQRTKDKGQRSMDISPPDGGEGGRAPKTAGKSKAGPPTREEMRNYCAEIGISEDPDYIFDYYESNGWRVGKNPMKDWKAAVRRWGRNGFNRGGYQGKVPAGSAGTGPLGEMERGALERLLGNQDEATGGTS